MDLKSIAWTKEDTSSLITSTPVYVASLNAMAELWIDRERSNQISFSKKQREAFEMFLTLHTEEIDTLYAKLEQYGKKMFRKNRITKASVEKKIALQLNFRAIIIPLQRNTPDKYIHVLADTNWKIKHSSHVLELEMLFKNNRLVLLQEYTGLWTRLEWNAHYNVVTRKRS